MMRPGSNRSVAFCSLLCLLLAGCGPTAETPPDSGFLRPGPDIEVTPSAKLDFGPVGWFADKPIATSRKLVIQNVGGGIAPNDNLKIWNVEARSLTLDASDDEIAVRFPSSWDPSVGLPSQAGTNAMELEVVVTVASFGTKRWELAIDSNDPDEPRRTIEISADVIYPPCRFEVSPERFDLLVLSPPEFRDVVVTIRNLGSAPEELCKFWGFGIVSENAGAFALPAGPIAPFILQAGELRQITVRVFPPWAGGQLNGALEFQTSSPPRPTISVPISTADIPPSCIAIAPDYQDFGTVLQGCTSNTRVINVYNTCSTAVVIDEISMNGAGQAPGGPDCQGTEACPEFILVSAPTIPEGGLRVQPGQAPVSLAVMYRPIDLGADTGSLSLRTGGATESLTFVVPLNGNGDMNYQQIDVFTQDAYQFRTKFFLTAQPDRSRGPIEIRVDGQALASADPSGHIVWTYDATENAVTFDSMNVPANGQMIEIEYRVVVC